MSSIIRHITIDCADPYSLGSFWSDVLGAPLADDDEPGDPEALLAHDHGPPLLFVTVDDPKVVKNRVHLDIRPRGGTRDAEVERLVGLGATLVADHRRADGTGWVTLADPEGNEFCVEQSRTERND
jgi:predicted enzyme related to lactoylglutathione lyase